MPPSIPPKLKKYDESTLQFTNSNITGLLVGRAEQVEGEELEFNKVQVENDASEVITAHKETIEYVDETDGTEDVVYRRYILVGGTLGLVSSTKLYTSEPTGGEAPVLGCVVLADRSNWDPASKGSGGPYYVWYDGAGWKTMESQGA